MKNYPYLYYQVLGELVRGPLHPHQGDAEGAGGARPAEGDHGEPEDGARQQRHGLGRHQEVHLRRLLPPGRAPPGHRRGA